MLDDEHVGTGGSGEKYIGRSRITLMLRFILCPLLLVGILFVAFCAWSFVSYGDIRTGVAVVNGFKLIVRNHTLRVGEVHVGESRVVKFHLKNICSQPVVVLGAWAECDCFTTDELPVTIQPYSELEFDVSLHVNSSMVGQNMSRLVLLNLNVDQPAVALTVEFEVAGTQESTDVK
jgi:hypothetical protein